MFDGCFYQQTHGATMGSTVSRVVANLYMEHFEERAIHPAVYRLDDKCLKIQGYAMDSLSQHINNIDPLKRTRN